MAWYILTREDICRITLRLNIFFPFPHSNFNAENIIVFDVSSTSELTEIYESQV
jgi:hypothetical protein